VALRPIEFRLDGDELHSIGEGELRRWGGYLNGRRAAYTLVTPHDVARDSSR